MIKFDRNNKWLLILISVPILLFLQYFLFKVGFLSPMVRGIEIKLVNGDYVTEIDEYTIKLNEEVKLSKGDFICIPTYAKKPEIEFRVLDDKGILEIKGEELIGKKEGISTIGVMKDQRVLRKVNVRVIDPEVERIEYNIDKDLEYVGDTATITSNPIVDYDKFKEKEKVVYESSNKDVIKINGDEIEAVGPGIASVYIKSGDVVETKEYNIQVNIAQISINNTIEIEEGKSKRLNPHIVTMPVGLSHPKVKYELVENKLGPERSISLDKNTGIVTGLKEGTEKVKIKCGNKEKIIKIIVSKDSLTANKVENIKYSYEVIDGKLIVSLSWDYMDGVDEYYIYLKNNSLNDSEFNLYDSLRIQKDELDSNRVHASIEIELVDGKIPSIDIKVAGKTKYGTTKPSDTISIRPEIEEEDIQNLEVKNLQVSINDDNTATLKWDTLDLEGVLYSIYVKNNLNSDSGFKLMVSEIGTNYYTINIPEGEVDMEIYVAGSKDGKYSKKSNVIPIKRDITDEETEEEENLDTQI